MPLPGDQVPPGPGTLMRTLVDMQRQLDELRAARSSYAGPWIPIPLYRTFHDSAVPDATNTYETLPVSSCDGGVVWEGRIGKVSHPKIQYEAVLGRASGASGAPTYTLHVGDVQLDSFATTSYAAALRGPFDISSKLGQTNLVVQLRCSASGTGTDRIAMGMLGCWMRQA